MRRALAVAAILAALALPAGAETLAVLATPVPLNPEDPAQTTVGTLIYRGGLQLDATDGRFGGLSGMHVEPDGRRLTAVSDKGYWVVVALVHDEAGTLAGVGAAEIGDLRGIDGAPVAGTALSDAEELVRTPDRWLVAFERRARIWSYPDLAGRPSPVPAPAQLAAAPSNEGLEALALLGDGRLLALTEGLGLESGRLLGWVGDGRGWQPLEWPRTGLFKPTGAARLPDGRVVVLERRFTILGGAGARLTRLSPAAIRPGTVLEGEELAVIAPPLTVDNFEAVAARRGARGETLLYVLADDNYNVLQRTLLLQFELSERR